MSLSDVSPSHYVIADRHVAAHRVVTVTFVVRSSIAVSISFPWDTRHALPSTDAAVVTRDGHVDFDVTDAALTFASYHVSDDQFISDLASKPLTFALAHKNQTTPLTADVDLAEMIRANGTEMERDVAFADSTTVSVRISFSRPLLTAAEFADRIELRLRLARAELRPPSSIIDRWKRRQQAQTELNALTTASVATQKGKSKAASADDAARTAALAAAIASDEMTFEVSANDVHIGAFTLTAKCITVDDTSDTAVVHFDGQIFRIVRGSNVERWKSASNDETADIALTVTASAPSTPTEIVGNFILNVPIRTAIRSDFRICASANTNVAVRGEYDVVTSAHNAQSLKQNESAGLSMQHLMLTLTAEDGAARGAADWLEVACRRYLAESKHRLSPLLARENIKLAKSNNVDTLRADDDDYECRKQIVRELSTATALKRSRRQCAHSDDADRDVTVVRSAQFRCPIPDTLTVSADDDPRNDSLRDSDALRSERLFAWAAESEFAGRIAAAFAAHQRRCDLPAANSSAADRWYDFACFHRRHGLPHDGAARFCLRAAITVHPDHFAALTALYFIAIQDDNTQCADFIQRRIGSMQDDANADLLTALTATFHPTNEYSTSKSESPAPAPIRTPTPTASGAGIANSAFRHVLHRPQSRPPVADASDFDSPHARLIRFAVFHRAPAAAERVTASSPPLSPLTSQFVAALRRMHIDGDYVGALALLQSVGADTRRPQDIATAHALRGHCLHALQRVDESLHSYQAAAQWQTSAVDPVAEYRLGIAQHDARSLLRFLAAVGRANTTALNALNCTAGHPDDPNQSIRSKIQANLIDPTLVTTVG